MPLVCLRVDDSGTLPVLLDDQDELSCEHGVEWRFVAALPDPEEARQLVRQLHLEQAHGWALRARLRGAPPRAHGAAPDPARARGDESALA